MSLCCTRKMLNVYFPTFLPSPPSIPRYSASFEKYSALFEKYSASIAQKSAPFVGNPKYPDIPGATERITQR